MQIPTQVIVYRSSYVTLTSKYPNLSRRQVFLAIKKWMLQLLQLFHGLVVIHYKSLWRFFWFSYHKFKGQIFGWLFIVYTLWGDKYKQQRLYTESYKLLYGIVKTCPSWGTFQQHLEQCVKDSQCLKYQCVGEGYFPNPNTNDCSIFIACYKIPAVKSKNLLMYPRLWPCPQNLSFSPLSRKCNEYYTCGGKDLWKGICPCSTFDWLSPFNANSCHTKSTSYLLCVHLLPPPDNSLINVIVKKTCPPKTFFSPNIGKCYKNYNSSETCSKDPCGNGVGKFVDYKSGFCESFYECRDDSTMICSWVYYSYSLYQPNYERRYCPPGMLISPKIGDCGRDYVCPKFPVNYCYPPISTTVPPIPAAI